MTRKQKIQKLLNKLDELEGKNPSRAIERLFKEEEGVSRETLRDSKTGNALRILSKALKKVQDDKRPAELLTKLTEANTANEERFNATDSTFSEQIKALREEIKSSETRGTELTKKEVDAILGRLAELEGTFNSEKQTFSEKDTYLEGEVARLAQELPKIYEAIGTIPDYAPAIELAATKEGVSKTAEEITDAVKELEKRLTSRINNIGQIGGGNQNRNIAIGGNTNVLTPYTDINLKAGAGTTITYATNQTTKYTDITITANGGGSGITREVNNVSTPTAAGSTPGIDYVYLVSGTTTITMPTAVGNEDLYTIKNVGAGVVTIAFTGGETCDGSATLSLPVQYTSVDLISDGTNWNVT